jgi:phosphonate transport system permease protein
MEADIFVQRRKERLIFSTLLIILTVGSITITNYDVMKGFTSIIKAFIWGISHFYPDAKSIKLLPDILISLKETVLMSIAATTVAAVFAILLALAGSRTTRMNKLSSVVARGIALLFRNIPLVVWAMVLMLAFSQSSLTGYVALFLDPLDFSHGCL